MDFGLTREQEMLRDMVRSFAERFSTKSLCSRGLLGIPYTIRALIKQLI